MFYPNSCHNILRYVSNFSAKITEQGFWQDTPNYTIPGARRLPCIRPGFCGAAEIFRTAHVFDNYPPACVR